MKKTILVVMVVVLICVLCFSLLGCRKVNQANKNLKLDADNFKIYRRMTFVNLRTDKVLYEAEGYFSLQDSREDGSEISLTFKTGEDSYKIDYFSIDANVTYVIEQLENTNADPYHWHIYWYVKTPKVDYLGEE